MQRRNHLWQWLGLNWIQILIMPKFIYEPGRGAENSELYVAHALSKISNFFVSLLREP